MKKLIILSAVLFLCCALTAQNIEITGNGNLRSGPGTENAIIGKVTSGMKVRQIDTSGDWYKIELPGKSSGWISKALARTSNQGANIRQQKRDTVEIVASALADEIKGTIARYVKNEFFRTPLFITPVYPLEISMATDSGGNFKIEGKTEEVSLGGNISIKTTGYLRAIAYPKSEVGNDESTRPALSIGNIVTLQDNSNTKSGVMIFTTSGTSVSEETFVQCLKPGKFECSGSFVVNGTTPVLFESGTIIFTDNEKQCTFSEGTVMSYNSVKYIFSKSKWSRN